MSPLLLLACAPNLPRLPVSSDFPGAVAEGYILGTLMGEEPSIFIADREGYLLWEYPGQVGIQSPVAVPSRDGTHLLFNRVAADRGVDISEIDRLLLGGAITERIRTDSGHHTFQELADGTLAYLAIDVRETEEYGPVVGDRVLELHPDGSVTEVFSVWDHLNLVYNENWEGSYYPQGYDWTHGNALYYDEATDTYLVSFRNINAFVEVARSTGEVLRQFGGQNSDYAIDGEGFRYQHGVYWTPEGHLLMTSSDDYGGELETRAVEYAVDPERRELEQVWAYGEGLGIHARALGEVHRMRNGNTLINFGTAGLLREVSPDGTTLWEIQLSDGDFFGRAQLLEDISGLLDY